jgi:lipooligosaccharide transport system ATP-binding protein
MEPLFMHKGMNEGEAKSRALELLRMVGISDAQRRLGQYPHQFSGGMRQRVMIAIALACNPKLIIADEPTTGLDPQARHLIWQRLRELKRQGTTLILTTQYMEEAEQLCDRVVVMYQGKFIKEGTPQGLIAEVIGNEVTEIQIGSDQDERIIQHLGGVACEHERVGDILYFYCRDGQEIMKKVLELNLPKVLHRPASLEDVFLKLTGRSLVE